VFSVIELIVIVLFIFPQRKKNIDYDRNKKYMPQRRKQRFGRLHQTLKATNYSATSGAAGEFLNYLKGINKLLVARKPGSSYLRIFNVGVIPFGEEPDSTSGAKNPLEANMTVQADNIKALFSSVASDALFGIERIVANCTIDERFYAAQCRISVVPNTSLTTTKETKTSQITKNLYKRYIGVRTGSIPYGRTTTASAAVTEGGVPTTPTIATETEEDSRKSISNALRKGTVGGQYTVLSLSFIPEEFVDSRSFSKGKPSGAPTDIPSS